MKEVGRRHQKKIAYKTLKMLPSMANIAGGLSYEEAYEIIFKYPLRKRLRELIAEYGDKNIVFELSKFGWLNAREVLEALGGDY